MVDLSSRASSKVNAEREQRRSSKISQAHFSNTELGNGAAVDVAIIPMTKETIPLVAKVHLEAFAGNMNTRLGTRYVRAFMDWFCQADRGIALAATDSQGHIIGYVVGAPSVYARTRNRHLFWVAAAGIVLRPWLFLSSQFRRLIIARLKFILARSRIEHVEPNLIEPTMSLVGIAVASSARRKKVGLRLMQAFEEKARELQMRSLRLSVDLNNRDAQKLYESCGWQPCHHRIPGKPWIYYFRILTEDTN